MKPVIVLAAGGTGGHVSPALAVAEELAKRGVSPHFVLPERDVEKPWMQNFPWECTFIPAHPPRRKQFWKTFPKAIQKCRHLFSRLSACGLLAFGSYPSLAPAVAARSCSVPLVCFEQNAVPGRATRWLSPFSRLTILPWEETGKYLPLAQEKLVLGNPIRQLERVEERVAREKLGLCPDLPTVLVLGGSQGAHGVNRILWNVLPRLSQEPLQWIHISGSADYRRTKWAYERLGLRALVLDFCTDMGLAYSAASLLIGRSGGGTLAEALSFHLPMLLIPYPHAAQGHQEANGLLMERYGAALVLCEERAADPAEVEALIRLMLKPEVRERMSSAAAKVAKGDSAAQAAQVVMNLLQLSRKEAA